METIQGQAGSSGIATSSITEVPQIGDHLNANSEQAIKGIPDNTRRCLSTL